MADLNEFGFPTESDFKIVEDPSNELPFLANKRPVELDVPPNVPKGEQIDDKTTWIYTPVPDDIWGESNEMWDDSKPPEQPTDEVELASKREVMSDILGLCLIDLPFVREEYTMGIVERSLKYVMQEMDRYRPWTIAVNNRIDSPDYVEIRAYTSMWDTNMTVPFSLEFGYTVGMRYIYTHKWTFNEIKTRRVDYRYYQDLCKYRIGMYIANVRRSANMEGMPFDLKGDGLFEEYQTKYNELLRVIQNMTHNTL